MKQETQVHLIADGEQAKSAQPKSRAEHLAWCKQRALEYCVAGKTHDALASMASDLGKHPDTAGHIGIQLGMMQIMGGMLSTPDQMRHFIKGFN